MDSSSIIQLASALSSQDIAVQQQTAIVKLANEQLEAQGAALLQMLNSVPAATATSGNIINIKV
ncbi:YjfB family protein [Methylophaga sp. OBS3]|uniref:YjfB family protein n=1 Tax=Methylophaga sp. OBS3 TaxID=2991934 RepID=UPI00225091E2|nr:YjfB family protein [Methylophaga sp. OBS3]MCX4189683.1 YjfB family protein [Methylophaga sp. OBS3]